MEYFRDTHLEIWSVLHIFICSWSKDTFPKAEINTIIVIWISRSVNVHVYNFSDPKIKQPHALCLLYYIINNSLLRHQSYFEVSCKEYSFQRVLFYFQNRSICLLTENAQKTPWKLSKYLKQTYITCTIEFFGIEFYRLSIEFVENYFSCFKN